MTDWAMANPSLGMEISPLGEPKAVITRTGRWIYQIRIIHGLMDTQRGGIRWGRERAERAAKRELARYRREIGWRENRAEVEPDTLGGQLQRYLYETYAGYPRETRRQAQWVLNREWLDEVNLLRPVWAFDPYDQGDGRLFGLPMVVREDAGAPRLVPADA